MACSFIGGSRVVVLDEPTTGVGMRAAFTAHLNIVQHYIIFRKILIRDDQFGNFYSSTKKAVQLL